MKPPSDFPELAPRVISELSVCRLSASAVLPKRAHPEDAGLDLTSLEDATLGGGEGRCMRTGIAMAIPTGFVGLIADRSSLAKRGLKTLGGVIDAGYRGELQIVVWNLSDSTIELKTGERIAQLLIIPMIAPQVVEVEGLDETLRGHGGFGSTGR